MAARKKAETKAQKVIEIPQVNLQRMMVRIVGRTPLLMNRFSERAVKAIEDKQQHGPKGPKEAREPEAEFKAALHVLAPNLYGFPAEGLKKALVSAGGRFADEKMTHLRGILNIETAHVVIEADEPRMRSDPVRLPSGGRFTVAYRPEFFPWFMNVPVVFNASMIGQAQVLNLFQIAGFSVGLGSWRPETNGSFGQFALADEVMPA